MKEIVKFNGEDVELGDDATKQREAVREELKQLLLELVDKFSMLCSIELITVLSDLLAEEIHWMFDTTGKHAPASAMIATMPSEPDANLPGLTGMVGMTNIKKGQKYDA